MEYAWEVRLAGGKIAFQPDVSIQAEMLSPEASLREPGRRWELAAGRSEPPTLVLSCAPALGLWTKFLSLCELTMPTMAMLTIIYVVVAAVDGSFILAPVDPPIAFFRRFLVACAAIMTLSLVVYAGSPFIAMRLASPLCPQPGMLSLLSVWKFWAVSGERPDRWVRTPREPKHEGPPRFADKLP